MCQFAGASVVGLDMRPSDGRGVSERGGLTLTVQIERRWSSVLEQGKSNHFV